MPLGSSYPSGGYLSVSYDEGYETNTALAVSSLWSQDGLFSLGMKALSAGNVNATTPIGTSAVVCSPGETVRAMGFFHSPVVQRACTVTISFYNSAGAVISSVTSTSVNSTLSGNGGQAFVTTTAPALAATMSLSMQAVGLAATEVVYADCMLIGPGASTTWSAGGFVGSSVANLTFSDDNVNWFPVRNGTGVAIPVLTQQVVVIDYEGSLGFTRHYQGQVVG